MTPQTFDITQTIEIAVIWGVAYIALIVVWVIVLVRLPESKKRNSGEEE